jgi:uncharacterized protein (TIGR02246 family)
MPSYRDTRGAAKNRCRNFEGGFLMLRPFTKWSFALSVSLGLLASAPLQIASAEKVLSEARATDRAAIESLIANYAHVYDALDADGYASIFAEDAEFTFGGNTLRGRAAIRGVITGALERRAKAPANEPAAETYHIISNTRIDFVSDTEARHRSYWQVVSRVKGSAPVVANVGYYDDVVVKRNGEWLIQKRVIPQ